MQRAAPRQRRFPTAVPRPPQAPGQSPTMDQLVATPPRQLDLNLAWPNSFAGLGPAFYTELAPTPLPSPYLVGLNRRLAAELGLSAELLGARRRGGLDRQPAAGRLPPAGQRLQRPPVRRVGGAAGRWTGHSSGRDANRRRRAGAPAQGQRPHPLLAHGRRARRAALQHPRIPGVRGDARAGHPDHSRPHGHRLAGARAARGNRDRRGGHARRAQLHPLRAFRALLGARAARRAAQAGRLRHRQVLPRMPRRRRRSPATRTRRSSNRSASAPRPWSRSGRPSAFATA